MIDNLSTVYNTWAGRHKYELNVKLLKSFFFTLFYSALNRRLNFTATRNEMAECESCGDNISANYRFCPSCGSLLVKRSNKDLITKSSENRGTRRFVGGK